MSIFLAIIFVLLSVGLLSFGKFYFQQKVKSEMMRHEAAQQFYKSSKPLLEDSETPEEIIDNIGLLNDLIDDKQMVTFLLRFLRNDRWRSFQSNDAARFNKTLVEFFHERPELEKSHKLLVSSWFVAVTALAPIRGIFVRYIITNDAVADVATKVRPHMNNGDDCDDIDMNGKVHAH